MHDDRRIVEDRIRRFVDKRLNGAVYVDSAPLTVTAWAAPGEPVPFAEAVGQDFHEITHGTPWGPPWSTMWLHVTGTVPPSWRGRDEGSPEMRVELGFTGGPGFNAEGLVYRPDGTVVKGIAPRNAFVPIDNPDGPVDFYIEAAANPDIGKYFWSPMPLGDKATSGEDALYRLGDVDLALRDLNLWGLQQDIATLDGLMHTLPEDLPRRHEILRALERMLDTVDPDDLAGTAAAGREQLADVLARPAYASAHRITAVGHAHIDSAWLWPVRETVRKCARTFSNMVDLMDRHPDFRFACSSAQQYAWIKDKYPSLFARIKEKVAAGQFIPVGGMWVEADTNMPGAEAMARQFVMGKRFFLDEFGIDTPEVWLPDSFGYSAAMPQIVAASGSEYFLTQKISWNSVNRMPHHTFIWEGIDGTGVFTHFPPVDTYNSDLGGGDLAHAQRNYRDSGAGTMSLVPFGYGDGGGGPTREMLAYATRKRSLEGSPTVTLGTPAQFFADARAEYANPPRWSGELYLELHRGTYTSQANTKQGNRRSEHLLREAELWAATAAVRTGFEYPYAELDEIWKLVLLQQFHDILPGSSIAWVHKDAERNYAAIANRLQAVIEAATGALAGTGARKLVFNAAPHARDGVPALGASVADRPRPVTPTPAPGGFRLDNGTIAATFDADGLLVSLVDAVSGREAMAAPGNLLQLHRDTPNQWDAWDIDGFYRNTVTDLAGADSVAIVDDALVIARTFGNSRVMQRITLRQGSGALDIDIDIDWHESEKLLKLSFPFDVHADRSASETQFGHVYRPTHANTSWDEAKFEICAHRWVHVGESGYGVAVVNNSTYGHDISRRGSTTVVRMSLLRAPLFPDPDCDQGRHRLQFSVRPGATIGDAVEEGYRRNLDPRIVDGAVDAVEPLISLDNPAVVVESVKLALDGSGDVVVRLYESRGGRAEATLRSNFGHGQPIVTDLLERPIDESGTVSFNGDEIHLTLRPFKILTLRLPSVERRA
ncbi:Putative glycosyl hydrolase [Mycobacteroides abscessus subsp. abscessus]|uniref:alpha-mannosidase n=1 Tax=Mycobacteroides abscessus TaxID=36809 RepID=UPI0009A7BE44|nr:glycoside hydrolase family 38 C-terminal domain-containing protein [Mycobacteroides abscessus]SLE92017.1 Putative glycosyl hydrolase [Mycobacteroides abscessus subsp. abscessus]